MTVHIDELESSVEVEPAAASGTAQAVPQHDPDVFLRQIRELRRQAVLDALRVGAGRDDE